MDPAVQKMIDNLESNTGKSFKYWIDLVKDSGFEKHGELVNFLKKDHGIGHGYANLIVHTAKKSSANHEQDDVLVEAQYKGKESLRPIYEQLLSYIQKLGPDVEIVPKKNSVSCKRKRQFVLIQPSTKTRIDLGLKFKQKPHLGRLETSGPFGTMCTHRVQLTEVAQVDAELKEWMKEAYHEAD